MKSLNESALLRAMTARGCTARLKALMRRAEAGEPITIGMLGGSITEGDKADCPENRYANRIAAWWRKAFPQSAITLVNAGIGATNSAIGAFRLDRDLLAYKPDLAVIEYAVNDSGPHPTDMSETYESIVRRCLQAGAAVLLLFLPRRMHGDASPAQRRIGHHYNLPMISVVDALEPCFDDGTLQWSDYGADDVHPNPDGHRMIADLIGAFLESVRLDRRDEADSPLPPVMTGEIYRNAVLLGSDELTPLSLGSFTVKPDTFRQFRNGWTSAAPGAPLVFELNCRTAQLLIHRSIDPSTGTGKAVVEANGQTAEYEMNAFFENGWGDYAFAVPVFRSETPQKIRISVYDTDRTFTLLRVMFA